MSSSLGESRTELLIWLNDLLQLNYKKVEECGTGAAYCQIMDSIYNDIPMHRVKFNATAEYEFHTNYKILQSCFARHKIEKIVYVEKLVRCRFQDNLEFLQWIKKYWLQNKDGSPYDADARRKHRQINIAATTPMSTSNVSKRKTSGYGMSAGTPALRSSSYSGNRRVSNEQLLAAQTELTQAQNKVNALNKDIEQFRQTTNILEREREFYFGKLRDIEIVSQSTQDLIKEGVYKTDTSELEKFLNKVQQILYADNTDNNEILEEISENNAIHDMNEENTQSHNIKANGTTSGIDSEDHYHTETLASNENNILNLKTNSQQPQNLIIDEETF